MILRLLIAPCLLLHMHCRRPVLIVGVRGLRQNASEVLRAVDAGEPATVTVAGRAVAQILPIRGAAWITWNRVKGVFDSPTDAGWGAERLDFGAVGLRDPWAG